MFDLFQWIYYKRYFFKTMLPFNLINLAPNIVAQPLAQLGISLSQDYNLANHTTHVVNVNFLFMNSATNSLNVNRVLQIWESIYGNFIDSMSSDRRLLRGKFYILFCSRRFELLSSSLVSQHTKCSFRFMRSNHLWQILLPFFESNFLQHWSSFITWFFMSTSKTVTSQRAAMCTQLSFYYQSYH